MGIINNILDTFDGSSIDTTKWSVTTGGGITYSVSNGLLNLSGLKWSGLTLTNINLINLKHSTSISIELDFNQKTAHYTSADVPRMVFGSPDGIVRELSKGYAYRYDTNIIELRLGNQNSSTYINNFYIYAQGNQIANCVVSISYNVPFHVKFELDLVNKLANVYFNNTKVLSSDISSYLSIIMDSNMNTLPEFNYNTYNQLQCTVDNLQIMNYGICGLFVIGDGNNIEITNGADIIVKNPKPCSYNEFELYGMQDLTNINSTVLSKIISQKYNIEILK